MAAVGVDKTNNRLCITDRKSGEQFLVDTGAEVSVLAVKKKQKPIESTYKLYAANGTPIDTYGEKTLHLDIGIRRNYKWNFIIANTKKSILGADFLKHHRLLVDLYKQKLIDNVTKLAVEAITVTSTESSIYIVNQNLPYYDILSQFPDIQRTHAMKTPPKHNVTHRIETTGSPLFCRPRPLAPEKKIAAKKEFEMLMDMGICRPSSSPWASPIHIVKKANGELRICGDYRRLNAVTIPDRYPIPRMQDFTTHLHGKTIFSKIDIRKAYYWIPMASEEDIQKTAVTTPFGLFEFTAMTFGLRNATQTYVRFMHEILKGLDDVTFSFVDDVIIYSSCEEDHKKHLYEVLKRLDDYGIGINIQKCEFGKQEVNYLGYKVSTNGIQPLDEKVEAISTYPKPKTIEELRRFLGLINFYRDFLPQQAQKQRELNNLLHNTKKKDKTPIIWNEESTQAFELCRQSIKEATLLTHPVPGAEISIMTDASNISVGAVLQQRIKDNWQPIAFFSKSLSEAQRKYSVYDRELLAIYMSIKHFRKYIEGIDVTVYTDHKPLTYALSKPPSNCDTPRRDRQLEFISQFSNKILYVEGQNNPVADALSRIEEIECPSTIDYSQLSKDQENDEELKMLLTKKHLKFKKLKLPHSSEEIICEISTDTARPYLPNQFRKAAYKALHEISHPGIRNTRKLLTSKFFWPSMNKDVNEWTKTCLACQKSKVHRHTITPLAQFQETRRFEHIHMDIVGPLPPSNDYKYIVTIIDRCTKWPEAIPVRDITAETVTKALYEGWITRFGCPLRITTDQGRQFESTLFNQLMKKFGIERTRTTAYHPQANGQVERWHRTMKTSLLARENTKNWSEELPTVLMGLRAALHKSNNISPATYTYGSTLRLPADLFIPTKSQNSNQDEPELVRQLMKSLEEIRPSTITKSTTQHNIFLHKDLATCTHVFLRVDATRKSLTPPYEGPYEVLEKHPKFYRIQLPTRTSLVSLDRLKPAFVSTEDTDSHKNNNTITPPQNEKERTTRYGRKIRPVVRFALS